MQKFEDPTFPPTGWITIDRGDARNWHRAMTFLHHPSNNTWQAYIFSYPPCAWALEDYLVTPAIDLTDPGYKAARVRFYMWLRYDRDEWTRLYASTTQTTPWTGEIVEEWTFDVPGMDLTVPLTPHLGKTIYLAWGYKVWNCGGWDLSIDSITVEAGVEPVYDLAVVDITEPKRFMPPGKPFSPECVVGNLGTVKAPAPVRVYCMITDEATGKIVYDETHGIPHPLDPGKYTDVTFEPWTPEKDKDYTIEFKLEKADIPLDPNEENDRMDMDFTTRVACDVTPVEIVSPSGKVTPPVTPIVKVKNVGVLGQKNVPVRCIITDLAGTEKYNKIDTIDILPADKEEKVSFPDWAGEKGEFTVIFITELEGDENPTNDTIRGKFTGITEEISHKNIELKVYQEIGGFTLDIQRLRGKIEVSIYDIAGKKVKSLYDGMVNRDVKIKWDGITDKGDEAPNGIYLVRVSTEDKVRILKAVLLK